MKTPTIALLAILTVGAGFTGTSLGTLLEPPIEASSYDEKSDITGHIEIVHRDAEGNVIGYQQTDNLIVNEGLNCITRLAFATTNGTCAAASPTDRFSFIGLLGSSPSISASDTAASLSQLTGNGLDPVNATTIGIDVEGDGAGSTQGKSITALQHTFTKTNSGSVTVGGATVENSAGDAVFAARAFSGGDISLNENDTLEVTWQIQLGS